MYYVGRYLISCLGREERTIEFTKRQVHSNATTLLLEPFCEKGFVKQPFAMNYFFNPWRLVQWFFQVVKVGIVQYMIMNPLSTIIVVMIELNGVYGEGEFKWCNRYN